MVGLVRSDPLGASFPHPHSKCNWSSSLFALLGREKVPHICSRPDPATVHVKNDHTLPQNSFHSLATCSSLTYSSIDMHLLFYYSSPPPPPPRLSWPYTQSLPSSAQLSPVQCRVALSLPLSISLQLWSNCPAQLEQGGGGGLAWHYYQSINQSILQLDRQRSSFGLASHRSSSKRAGCLGIITNRSMLQT